MDQYHSRKGHWSGQFPAFPMAGGFLKVIFELVMEGASYGVSGLLLLEARALLVTGLCWGKERHVLLVLEEGG